VIVALVLGASAAAATYGYLEGLRRAAEAGSQMTEVLVASQDIPRGASADDLMSSGAVERVRMPQRYVAAGAISSARAVSDRILAVPVSKGEVLTTGRFQYPSEAGLAYNVPKDFVAIAVPVDENSGVAGLVKPSDRVVVFATVAPKGGNGEDRTRVIIPGARVLAVGRSTGTEPTATTTPQRQGSVLAAQRSKASDLDAMKNVTLALSAEDAEKVVLAAEVGSVWLALLPATESEATPGPGQTVRSVLK